MGLRILKITRECLERALSLPKDVSIIGMSMHEYFAEDAIALKIDSKDFPEVKPGNAIPTCCPVWNESMQIVGWNLGNVKPGTYAVFNVNPEPIDEETMKLLRLEIEKLKTVPMQALPSAGFRAYWIPEGEPETYAEAAKIFGHESPQENEAKVNALIAKGDVDGARAKLGLTDEPVVKPRGREFI